MTTETKETPEEREQRVNARQERYERETPEQDQQISSVLEEKGINLQENRRALPIDNNVYRLGESVKYSGKQGTIPLTTNLIPYPLTSSIE